MRNFDLFLTEIQSYAANMAQAVAHNERHENSPSSQRFDLAVFTDAGITRRAHAMMQALGETPEGDFWVGTMEKVAQAKLATALYIYQGLNHMLASPDVDTIPIARIESRAKVAQGFRDMTVELDSVKFPFKHDPTVEYTYEAIELAHGYLDLLPYLPVQNVDEKRNMLNQMIGVLADWCPHPDPYKPFRSNYDNAARPPGA